MKMRETDLLELWVKTHFISANHGIIVVGPSVAPSTIYII